MSEQWLSAMLRKANSKDPEPKAQSAVKADVKEVENILKGIQEKIQRS